MVTADSHLPKHPSKSVCVGGGGVQNISESRNNPDGSCDLCRQNSNREENERIPSSLSPLFIREQELHPFLLLFLCWDPYLNWPISVTGEMKHINIFKHPFDVEAYLWLDHFTGSKMLTEYSCRLLRRPSDGAERWRARDQQPGGSVKSIRSVTPRGRVSSKWHITSARWRRVKMTFTKCRV